MKNIARLLSVVLVFMLVETTLAQSKSETAEWINTQGKEILRSITNNPSIQWQMDEYGRLKITNFKPKKEGEAEIVKRYSYFNLYELDPKESLIRKSNKDESIGKLMLQCKSPKQACIKSRHYNTDTNFKTFATASLSFQLRNEFDKSKGRRLEKVLIHAIKLVQENN